MSTVYGFFLLRHFLFLPTHSPLHFSPFNPHVRSFLNKSQPYSLALELYHFLLNIFLQKLWHHQEFVEFVEWCLVHYILSKCILDHVKGVCFEHGKFLCCDIEAKQPPGKCEFHRNKKFDE